VPEKQKARMLKIEPTLNDDNALEQLVAAAKRIEGGLSDMVDAVCEGPVSRERRAALALGHPEPAWLGEVRARYLDARACGASVVIVPRSTVEHVLVLLDAARKA
jgi:hypothetical protein